MHLFPFFKKSKIFVSTIHGILEIKKSYGYTTLFMNNIPQSGGEFVSMWNRVLSKVAKDTDKCKEFLVLGVGGGTVIHTIYKYYPQAKVIGVDIDPLIMQLAKETFHIQYSQCHLVIEDVNTFIQKQTKNSFDCIVVDIFVNQYNIEEVRTSSFLHKLMMLVRKDGVVIFNSHYDEKNSREFAIFKKMCQKIFTHVEEIFRFPRNCVLLLR